MPEPRITQLLYLIFRSIEQQPQIRLPLDRRIVKTDLCTETSQGSLRGFQIRLFRQKFDFQELSDLVNRVQSELKPPAVSFDFELFSHFSNNSDRVKSQNRQHFADLFRGLRAIAKRRFNLAASLRFSQF